MRYWRKYFTASDYNELTNNILDAKIKDKNLVNSFDISGFIKNIDLNEKDNNISNNGRNKSRSTQN